MGEIGHDLITSQNYAQSSIWDCYHSAQVLPTYANDAVGDPPTATGKAKREPDAIGQCCCSENAKAIKQSPPESITPVASKAMPRLHVIEDRKEQSFGEQKRRTDKDEATMAR